MSYQSFEQVLQKCHTEGKKFWQVIMEDDMAERNVSKQDSMEHMRTTWDAMLLAAATYEGDIKSSSGLVGGDGQRMEEYTHNTGKESLCGEYVDECIAGALQMGESNACMKGSWQHLPLEPVGYCLRCWFPIFKNGAGIPTKF
jgi:L-serine dehydratase